MNMRINTNPGSCRRCGKYVSGDIEKGDILVSIWNYVGWYCIECREKEWKILETIIKPNKGKGSRTPIQFAAYIKQMYPYGLRRIPGTLV